MAKHIFRLHSLYADHGDCLWIEYGDEAAPHRVIVDCGTTGTYKRLAAALEAIKDKPGVNELLVITHVDADHIAGALPLLSKPENATLFKEVWFNGRAHLEPSTTLEHFGAVQGERLSKAILDNEIPWNSAYGSKSISLEEGGAPKRLKLPGGMVLTILSPTWDKLRAMKDKWDKEIAAAGLNPAIAPEPQVPPDGFEHLGLDVDALADIKFEEDKAAPNGSSIAFLLEYKGKSMLLGADAHPTVLVNAVKALKLKEPLVVDLLKIPHHGSKNNTSKELLKTVGCRAALFSSNGAVFRHPDKEAVARVIKYAPSGVEIVFNCRTEFNKMWDAAGTRKLWNYTVRYGAGEEGISVDLF